MRAPSHPENVILTLLKEADTGTPIGQVCKTASISTRTFYRWRAQYGGLNEEAARERNDLIRENLRLRALVKDLLHKVESGSAAGVPTTPLQPVSRREPATGRFGSVRGKR